MTFVIEVKRRHAGIPRAPEGTWVVLEAADHAEALWALRNAGISEPGLGYQTIITPVTEVIR